MTKNEISFYTFRVLSYQLNFFTKKSDIKIDLLVIHCDITQSNGLIQWKKDIIKMLFLFRFSRQLMYQI